MEQATRLKDNTVEQSETCYNKECHAIEIITDRVRSTREGYVLTRVWPSICLSTPRGVPRWGRGVP